MPVTPPKPGEPWWVPAAITFMDGVLTVLDRPSVFEWGCGGSTVWLAARSNALLSIEHSREWFDKISPKLPVYANVALIGLGEAYERMVVGRRPKIVCVDGRRRVACIENAIPCLQPGGFILLDNSERERYKPAMDLMKDWPQWHFEQGKDWRTSIWRKP